MWACNIYHFPRMVPVFLVCRLLLACCFPSRTKGSLVYVAGDVHLLITYFGCIRIFRFGIYVGGVGLSPLLVVLGINASAATSILLIMSGYFMSASPLFLPVF